MANKRIYELINKDGIDITDLWELEIDITGEVESSKIKVSELFTLIPAADEPQRIISPTGPNTWVDTEFFPGYTGTIMNMSDDTFPLGIHSIWSNYNGSVFGNINATLYNSGVFNTTGNLTTNENLIANGGGPGHDNTAIGTNALGSDGNYNIAIGTDAMRNGTGGDNNIAIGYQSLLNLDGAIPGTADDVIAIGYQAMQNALHTKWSVAIGSKALQLNTVGTSVAIGFQSLNRNTSVSVNSVAIGTQTLQNNVDGINNVAIGEQSMQYGSTGSYNVAIGRWSLASVANDSNTAIGYSAAMSTVLGSKNVAIGFESLKLNSVGNQNVSIGYQTMYNNTDGYDNVAMGYHSLFNNTSGRDNIAFGFKSLKSNITGIHNIAIGSNSLESNTDNTNIGIGTATLFNNTTGSKNIAIGYTTLHNNIIKSRNIGIGFASLYHFIGTGVDTESDNIAIGSQALKSTTTGYWNTAIGNNTLISNISGQWNVAIGNDAAYNNTIGTNNVVMGVQALYQNQGGNSNTAIGHQASYNNTSGLNNTSLGKWALSGVTTFSNCTGLGSNAAVTASNQVQLGDASTTTYVYGTVQNRSDERDKVDIQDTILGLDFINNLRPVDFKWNYREKYKKTVSEIIDGETVLTVTENINDGSQTGTRLHHGFIAQEIETLITQTGIDFGGYQDHSINGGDDVKSIGYDEIIAPLVKAVQELSARLTALETI